MPLIDTHCHIDMYDNPHIIAEESERLGIITIGMTLLPSHFEIGINHVRQYKKIRLALGMHPLQSEQHEKEFNNFLRLLDHTSYIGEIGLDFSKEGIRTKEIQLNSFTKILQAIQNKKKIINIHSRKAETEVLQLLTKYNIKNAIIHWYSGSTNLINKIIESGYYFSINPAMVISTNGKKIINAIPRDRLLTETDGPFISRNGNAVKPADVSLVLNYFSTLWNIPIKNAEQIIFNNFSSLFNQIK